MRALRRRGFERTRWTLDDFLRQTPGEKLPAAWILRMTQAQQRLQEFARRPQSPLAWAELAPQLLEAAGWPGARPLASGEFQALRRWQQEMDGCASLGFDGRPHGMDRIYGDFRSRGERCRSLLPNRRTRPF